MTEFKANIGFFTKWYKLCDVQYDETHDKSAIYLNRYSNENFGIVWMVDHSSKSAVFKITDERKYALFLLKHG